MLTILHGILILYVPGYIDNRWIINHFSRICNVLTILDMLLMCLGLYVYLQIRYPS